MILIKRMIGLCLCLCLCLSLASCRNEVNYELEVLFENENDKVIFEKRLGALDIEIIDSRFDGTAYTYDVKTSHLDYDQSTFELLCENHDVEFFVNGEIEELSRDDVISVKIETKTTTITVSESLYKHLYDIEFGRFTRIFVDDVEYDIMAGISIDTDNELYFVHHDGCEECLQMIAIYFVAGDVDGDINIKLVN